MGKCCIRGGRQPRGSHNVPVCCPSSPASPLPRTLGTPTPGLPGSPCPALRDPRAQVPPWGIPRARPVPGTVRPPPRSSSPLLSSPPRPVPPPPGKRKRGGRKPSAPRRAAPRRTGAAPRPGPPWLPSATSSDGACGAPAAEVSVGRGHRGAQPPAGGGRCRVWVPVPVPVPMPVTVSVSGPVPVPAPAPRLREPTAAGREGTFPGSAARPRRVGPKGRGPAPAPARSPQALP
ncbi:PREDICTED: basic proline-rich protein-like [Charadrius vociferus]|uniref:basic proline-rich protein-like n=1 Tax=Charadrius vociferus TaxID=50402 RepID=UPI000521C230|nr:PREDICTED: basic proline-rich protein-like [Charadrius vociferus]